MELGELVEKYCDGAPFTTALLFERMDRSEWSDMMLLADETGGSPIRVLAHGIVKVPGVKRVGTQHNSAVWKLVKA